MAIETSTELLTVQEIARELGLKDRCVLVHIHGGRIKIAQRVGKSILVTRDDVEKFKSNRRSPGRPPTQK